MDVFCGFFFADRLETLEETLVPEEVVPVDHAENEESIKEVCNETLQPEVTKPEVPAAPEDEVQQEEDQIGNEEKETAEKNSPSETTSYSFAGKLHILLK